MNFQPRFGMPPQQYFVAVPTGPQYFVHQPFPNAAIVTSGGPRGAPRHHKPPPAERPPTTTLFVGNIHERCSNDLIRAMLQECGNVINWKRIQGSNGKFQAFGFCEYDHPESTLRALRLLNGWTLGDKKILVKVDDKTRELLRGFIDKKRQSVGRSPLKCEKDEVPCDEELTRTDPEYKRAIDELVRQQAGDLAAAAAAAFVVEEEGEIAARSPTLQGKGGNLDITSLDRDKKEYIAREISHFRETHKEDEAKRKEREDAELRHARKQARQRSEQRERQASEQRHASQSPSRESVTSREPGETDPTDSPVPPRPREPTEERVTRASPERPRSRSAHRSSSRAMGEQHKEPARDRSVRDRGAERERNNLVEQRRRERKRTPPVARPPSSEEEKDQRTGRRSRSSSGSSRGTRASKRRRRDRTRSRSRSRSRSRVDSEEEEEARERKELERKLKEKEKTYKSRLVKWEGRERRKAKEYERFKEKKKKTRREEQREAKKLKEFLEDYEDERDDPKFYKSSSLFQRRREYEKEREMDARDRKAEREEIEEMKKRLTDEGHADPEKEVLRIQQEQEETLLKKLRADSSEPPTPRRQAQKEMEENMIANGMRQEGEAESESSESSSSSGSDSDSEESDSEEREKRKKDRAAAKGIPNAQKLMATTAPAMVGVPQPILTEPQPDMTQNAHPEPEPATQFIPEGPKLGFGELKLNKSHVPGSSASVAQAFGDDEEGTVTGIAKKAFVPLELTEQERAETMTPEERKKLIKQLIERIPTTKERLFDYPINWTYVDEGLIQKRVRPWVNKKIIEYIGEEEQSLVDFICQKVAEKVTPSKILEDIAMVLDEEAEVFVVKMWRLLVYESEAKKLGLVKSDGSTS